MPPQIPVTLDIRNKNFPPGPGWTSVNAANGDQYSYKYSGGSDGNGNASVNQAGTEVIVRLTCDARYEVNSVDVSNDTHGDITPSQTSRTVTLTDSDADKDYSVYYSITIKDTTANTTFGCDPMIRNQP